MELGTDDGFSDGAVHGHATVVVLLGSADGAPASAAVGKFRGIDLGIVDNTADGTVLGIEVVACGGSTDGALLGM